MEKSPLRLDDSFVGEVHLLSHSEADLGEENVEVSVTNDYSRHVTERNRWLVRTKVVFGATDGSVAAYSGSVEVTGYFTVVDDLEEERHRRCVAILCPGVLYSTAREIVAFLTGRNGSRRLLLPTVSFADENILPEEIPENGSSSI